MGLYTLFLALDSPPDTFSSIDNNGDSGIVSVMGRDGDTDSDSESSSSTARTDDPDAVRTSARGRVEPLILGDMPEMLWGDTQSRWVRLVSSISLTLTPDLTNPPQFFYLYFSFFSFFFFIF